MTLIHHIILDHSVLIAANWCELQVRVAPPSAFHTWAATVAVAEFVALVAPSRRTVHHTGSRDDRDDPLGDLLMTLVFKHQPGDVHIWKLWKGWGKNMLNKKTVCFPEEALGLQNGNDACQETVDRPNMVNRFCGTTNIHGLRRDSHPMEALYLSVLRVAMRAMTRKNEKTYWMVTNSGGIFCSNLQQSCSSCKVCQLYKLWNTSKLQNAWDVGFWVSVNKKRKLWKFLSPRAKSTVS